MIIGGTLGDQHAAMVGQLCFTAGEAKNTYGTGNFLLLNTGTELVRSENGLLTTVCYQFGDEPPVYALEGSIAVTGSAVQWLRDQLKIIARSEDVEALAAEVDDAGGAYFVPAFSGLFAPYWRSDARGAIVGLSRFHTGAHLARATLEAICYQTRDVVEAMESDSGIHLDVLKVDGGVTAERAVHADPGRHARHRGDQAGGPRDHRARRRVRRRPRRRLLGLAGRPAGATGRRTGAGLRRSMTSSGRPDTPAGRRPYSGPLTGPRALRSIRCTPPPPRSVRTRAPKRCAGWPTSNSTCWSSVAG